MTAAQLLAVEPSTSDNALGLLVVAAGIVGLLLFRWFATVSKTGAVLALGLVALVVFGLGWEIAECAAGEHFGDPGDGSNPFDQFCPNDKGGSR